jgi:carboxypeptidase C (cathepsin A)
MAEEEKSEQAAAGAGKDGGKGADKKKNPPRPERQVTTNHTTVLGGRTLSYTATAGTLNLKDDKGEDRASVFYVAYVADAMADTSTRPVTFCFNGGPGSSAVWLQFGAFGPRRIDIPDTLASPPAPYRLVDNDQGILDLTDMVFIDPVGTGFSRAVGDTDAKEFHGVKGDVESVGEFIWRWLTRNNRWNSPKFLAGESYGTTRAAALSHHLQEKGVVLNGLVLVSLATHFQTFIFETGNVLPNALYLPSYAAVAHYHRKLPLPVEDRDAFLDEARRFALEEYAPALLQGANLAPERLEALARKLHRFTGLPVEALIRRRLQIHYLWFARTLLGATERTIGRLDARYVGPDLDPYGQMMNRDPSYDAPLGAYTALVNDFLRRQLGWETDDSYEVLSTEVNRNWKWDHDSMGYVNTTEELRMALIANPHLKVLFASGLYDLATPFFAAEYTASHVGVTGELSDNLTLTFYDAGHMMYFHRPSLEQLKADLAAFYKGARGGRR